MPDRRPTLASVAAAAGVSTMTVSNAYNRPDQLSAATRARILQVAAGLGYAGPDPAARSLRRGHAATVGVVLTEQLPYAFADPGMVSILHGIATELSNAGNALLLVPSSVAGTEPSEPLVGRAIVDGLILCALPETDPAAAAALARKLPLVTIGQPHLRHVPHVGVDNERSAALAAEHLAGLGHRRFCVLDLAPPPRATDVEDARAGMHARARGFTDWLARHVPTAEVALRYAPANTRAAAGAVLSDLVGAASPVTGLFAVTDVLALGAVDAAAAAGVRVPADLSVVGFDDIEQAATSLPPLTTVSQALFTQGQAAARLALRQIAGEHVASPRMRARLVVRASSGPVPDGRRTQP